jgi:predicted lipoprotein with Yx(FWY)xxD motif
MRGTAATATIALAAALLLGGCGSSGGSSSSSGSAPTVVSSAHARTGRLRGSEILVDSKGFALYAFSKDPKNTFHSHCLGSCEASWRPLELTGSAPVASGQVLGTQLGAIKRPGGKLQVDYAGQPLYTYVLEKKSGEALGNGVASFGGRWYALSPAGGPAHG